MASWVLGHRCDYIKVFCFVSQKGEICNNLKATRAQEMVSLQRALYSPNIRHAQLHRMQNLDQIFHCLFAFFFFCKNLDIRCFCMISLESG